MSKLIIVTCLMLFGVFYHMSGGADFQPRERVVASQAPFEKPESRHAVYNQPISTPVVIAANYAAVTTQQLENAQTTEVIIEQTIVPASVASEPAIVLHQVAGDRVNLRVGPGTDHAVIETLSQGTLAEIIAQGANGWAQIRLIDTDQTGWMAKRLLSDG